MKLIYFLLILAIKINTYSETILTSHTQTTHRILVEISNSLDLLQKEIQAKQELRKNSKLVGEKSQITKDLAQLFQQFQKASSKFEELATGIDTASFENPSHQKIHIADEIHTLIQPIITVAKSATNDMREKALLLEEIELYSDLLPKTKSAIENLQTQLKVNKVSKKVDDRIHKLISYWQKQRSLIESQYKSSKHELISLEQAKPPIFESIENKIRDFLKTRGFYLFEALFVSICILLLTNLFHTLVIKRLPQFKLRPRSFQMRILDLGVRIFGVVATGIGPMLVFYVEEDWILFSASILAFVGVFWVFRNTIPSLWQQSILLLNIGAVREGERVIYKDMPWIIKEIHLYSKLQNPTTGLQIKLPISELLTLISRKFNSNEPWFPCKVADWVLLSNNVYGKVEGISLKFIDLSVEGQSIQSFTVENFLGLDPINYTNHFAIKSIAGISYKHAKQCNSSILNAFQDYISKQLNESAYQDQVKNVSCEVHLLNSSSIDLAVIVNFHGTGAPHYRKLTRLLQQWTLDACNHLQLEIPFPQLDVHSIKSS